MKTGGAAQSDQPLYWVVHARLNPSNKPATRPWQIRHQWMGTKEGRFVAAFTSERAAQTRCADLNRSRERVSRPSFELDDLESMQDYLASRKATQGKPLDAGQLHAVSRESGMACDCESADADDCARGVACRMWRDFSLAPYGAILGDDEEAFDPGSGLSPKRQRELADLLTYVRETEAK